MTALPAAPIGSILARLLALHPKRIDLSLDRMWRILAALDHPQERLPPVIHVAGTNGKGSTIAFMRAMLEAAGRRVHVYTSPNLVRINERFRLGRPGGGVLVEDGELAEALEFCERKNGAAPITVFEIETAAAFLLFSRHPADVVLLEVGLGGRLDATNVIERPLASVITSVSMDHIDFLGDADRDDRDREGGDHQARYVRRSSAGRAKMRSRRFLRAENKSARCCTSPGKTGSPARNAAASSIRMWADCSTCRRRACSAGTNSTMPARRSRRCAWPASTADQGLRRRSGESRVAGAHAATARPAGWSRSRLRASELWIDGGHNADAGRIVAAALADLEERVSRPLVLVVGMLQTKDAAGFLRNFVGLARRLIAVAHASGQGVARRSARRGSRARSAFRRTRAMAWRRRLPESAGSVSRPRRAF